MTTDPTTTLASLATSQKSSSNAVWAWLIGALVTIVAIYVLWRLRRQAKRIEELELDKSKMATELDTLRIQLKQTANKEEAADLQAKITELMSKIDQRNHQLTEAKAKAETDKKDIEKVTSWDQI